MRDYLQKTPDQIKTKITPVIIPRSAHSISRRLISRNALKVLYRLHEAGYSAYLVGGCVRDLLLGYEPKDFDVATDARPEEVRKLFKNCRLIGKRFRLAHIIFGAEIIEVATFRTHHENAEERDGKTLQGMIIRDNVYGSIEDDALRRDFRMNALYYNIADFSVVDYLGGMQDIQSNELCMIGDPEKRFQEDPVRLLRAVRFAAKLNVTISPETESCLIRLNYLVKNVSNGRLFQEILKVFQGGVALKTIILLQKYQIFTHLFPQTDSFINHETTQKLIHIALAHTDQRIAEQKTISPAFLLTVILWHPICHEANHLQKTAGFPEHVSFERAIALIVKQQMQQLALPRVMQVSISEIVMLQHRLTHRRRAVVFRLLDRPRFRAAYDLLLLRAEAGEPVQELANWWTQFYDSSNEEREILLQAVNQIRLSPPKKRRRRSKKDSQAL